MVLETFIKGIEVLDKAEIKDMPLQGLVVGLFVFLSMTILGLTVTEDKCPIAIVLIVYLLVSLHFSYLQNQQVNTSTKSQ